MARSRFAFYRYFARRSTRLMRRTLLFIVLGIMAFALFDLQQPEHQRYVKSNAIRQSLMHRKEPRSHDPRNWPTWRGINTIFLFGDSQSDTGFNADGRQPDLENPLGNPAWPGRTSNYGANFIGHLTATFNQSFIRTYNLANRLAAVASQTDRLYLPSFGQQIEQKFLERYGESTKVALKADTEANEWGSVETLFVVYIGVEDLLHTTVIRHGGRNNTTIRVNIEAYTEGLETIYDAGGRNFLLINLPQLEEAPFMRNSGIMNYIWDFGAEIVQYNGRISFMAHSFAEQHLDANVFVFDNHKMSLAIRQNPKQFEDTSSYAKLTGFCFPYIYDIWWSETHNVYDESCEVPLDGWYWRDDMHVTEPYHKLMARQIVELLSDPTQRLPLEFY